MIVVVSAEFSRPFVAQITAELIAPTALLPSCVSQTMRNTIQLVLFLGTIASIVFCSLYSCVRFRTRLVPCVNSTFRLFIDFREIHSFMAVL